jgi:hypothetical protein
MMVGGNAAAVSVSPIEAGTLALTGLGEFRVHDCKRGGGIFSEKISKRA